MRGMSGPGTRDGFDRHDILPTRPRGQTPLEVTRQVRPGFRAKRRIALGITEARYIPPSLIS